MLKMTDTVKNMLKELTGQEGDYDGAFNIRTDGQSAGRQSTAAIRIEPKPNGAGLDIHIAPGTHRDKVHIPVVMTESGLKEVVYNDFHIGEGADVTIVAGCGIHNCGARDSEHDGIHRFWLAKNASVKYVEKHVGSGDGKGKRILNPVTEVYMEENSTMEMEMVQIRGVDDTSRSSTRSCSATPPAQATRNAIPSSWTTAGFWQCLAWRPTTSTRRSSMKPPSARSPANS